MVRVKKQTMEAVETKVNEALNAKADVSNMEAEAQAVKEASNDSRMVWVGCGIPMGQVLRGVGNREVSLNGVPVSKLVSAVQDGMPLPAGKFGLTEIPEEDWEAILKTYKVCDFIQNGVIFARKTKEEAIEEGRRRFEEKLGFEQAEKKGNTEPSQEEE